jgi:hypothetical protein
LPLLRVLFGWPQIQFFKMKLTISPTTRASIKALASAVIAGIVAVVAPSIQAGNFSFNWTVIWHTAVAAAVGYIGQKIVSPTPTTIRIDPTKTSVVDKDTKQTLVNANKTF